MLLLHLHLHTQVPYKVSVSIYCTRWTPYDSRESGQYPAEFLHGYVPINQGWEGSIANGKYHLNLGTILYNTPMTAINGTS